MLNISGTQINFLKVRVITFILSAILIFLSIGAFFVNGLNFGIDFKGGTLIEIETSQEIEISGLRDNLNTLELGDVQVQEFGSSKNLLIRVEQQLGGDQVQQDVVQIVKDSLGSYLSTDINFRRTEVVGPKVSGELIQSGAIAIFVAVFAMLVYIWFRFEWQFSLGAVLALVHDVILTIGVFCITQLEFNLPIIAAITLSRTIVTSVTTLLALLSLFIFGGEVIKGFTFAMIWGVIVGTYSSIFVAAPLLRYLDVKREWNTTSAVDSTR